MTSEITPFPRPLSPSDCAESAKKLPSVQKWLTDWQPEHDQTIPPQIAKHLPELKTAITAALMPPTEAQFTQALEAIWTTPAMFGIKLEPGQIAGATTIYRQVLSELPLDLLDEAIKRTISNWTYRNLPMPAEIRNHVTEELSRRRLIQTRIKIAEMYARWQGQ